ncbi:MAG: hypothetical protein ACKVQK_26660 [Burkholderiales bacterium]
MGFYYLSVFSIVPLGIAYGVLLGVYLWLSHQLKSFRVRKVILPVIATVFVVLPISEEFWIAWNFGQACNEAGTFINKKVQVDGFYDDTRSTHAGPPTAEAIESFDKTGYLFFEMKGRENFVRIEKVDGKWSSVVLDQPTAKYHYRSKTHLPYGHKIVKHESTLIDNQTKDILGLEISYGRYPSWFFIGLDTPIKICIGKRDVKGMLYENVLRPTMQFRESVKK